ncbi:MAG: hydroxypyruvate isomerase family protein [Pseudorhodoplanes sp.]|uniref:hydroxypyruvate isomerase family protein n=1 Tax=Pseudorhodoplanes sp. TaxID=1934341 RepID=UPI003D14C903
MPRFAANIAYLFPDRPLIERAAAAAAGGFSGVEGQFPYTTPAAALRSEIARSDLTMLGINTERGGEGQFGLAAVPKRERDFDALFAQALDYITAVGGRAIHCLAGFADVHARPAAERTFVANLTRAADLAAGKGITLLIEPINNRDRPDYFLNRVEQAADVIAKAGRPNIRIQFDFYHAQIMGGDLLRRFEAHLPLIGHIQIAAVPTRHEPDEGEVNYPEIFKAIDALGYTGWVAAEYHPRARTEEGLGWLRLASSVS